MNVAPDRTIILGLQIVLDHRSLSSIGQTILKAVILKLFFSKAQTFEGLGAQQTVPEAADNVWAALAKCYGRETKNKMLRPPQIKSCKQFETQTFVFNVIKSIVLNTLSLH